MRLRLTGYDRAVHYIMYTQAQTIALNLVVHQHHFMLGFPDHLQKPLNIHSLHSTSLGIMHFRMSPGCAALFFHAGHFPPVLLFSNVLSLRN